MLSIWLSIAPIFGLIVLGHLLRRGSIPSAEFWEVVDRLVYWVLLPSLLFYKMSTAQFDVRLVGSYTVVVIGAFLASVVLALVSARIAGFSGPVASSLLQGAARHNTFISLAAAERLYGIEGLEIAILAAALLIPVTNVTMVPLLISLASGAPAGGRMKAILRDLVRNPLLLSVGLGVAVGMIWPAEIPVLHDMTRLLGGAALPIVLLSVGASLRLRGLEASAAPMLLSSAIKLALFPVAAFLLARWIGLSEMETVIALLFAAAPTATSSYTLARQLGGDAPLMAAILTLQTALAFITLPVIIALAQWVFA
ncbi:MAG: AEC family transporter [Alphaproteobacteria bacterium]|nr:AEC family transporter [Alphaproteobacteria bacterium]